MKVILLGTAGYHPSDDRHTACMFVPQYGVVLDAGSGLFRLPRFLETGRLHIFLSHAHLDHVVGLTYLLGLQRQCDFEQVLVYGEADKLASVAEHLFSDLLFPVRPAFQTRALAANEPIPVPGGGLVRWFPLEHRGGTVGYRIDWPKRSLAYVTDTTASPGAPYREHIDGVDLLLHECYFPDDQAELAHQTGHSVTSAVAELALQARVGRVVLVHVNPLLAGCDPLGLERARRIFPNMSLGYDLMELDL